MNSLKQAIEAIRNVKKSEWDASALHDAVKHERGRRSKQAASRFAKGDRVAYRKDGRRVMGTVTKTYRKNVGVNFDEPLKSSGHTRYKVPASELEREDGDA